MKKGKIMKKFAKTIFVALVVLAFAVIVFPMHFFGIADAAVEGVSGNAVVLTGLSNTSPEHFFKDEANKDTFVNAKTKDTGKEYYSIVSKGKGTSSGWSEFCPTSDMKAFIEKGLLYAKASATVSIGNGKQTKITISSGGEKQEISGEEGRIETPLLKIKLDAGGNMQNIRFAFETSSLNAGETFVMDLPTIHLVTIIDSVILEDTSQNVFSGQIISPNAHNAVTEIIGATGNFLKFSKINHAIEFDFSAGEEYVHVVGKRLFIDENAPEGAKITFRAMSNKNSFSNEKIYSENEITFTVSSKQVKVKVRTDFEDPATFVGEEKVYDVGKQIALTVKPKPDFEFLGWWVDGEFVSQSKRVIAKVGQDIFAKFRKGISVAGFEVESREYDGTTHIDPNHVTIIFDGIEHGHELELKNLKLSYGDPNAGQNKLIKTEYEKLELAGKDAEIYYLKSQIIPNSYGEITKRKASVTPHSAQKEYGNPDPTIEYEAKNLVEGETLAGTFGREEGEDLGQYAITEGDLSEKNPNYDITLENEAFLEIVERKLTLSNVTVAEKTYDKTSYAEISAELENIFNNEDVSVSISGEFVSVDAGFGIEVKLTKVELYGDDCKNYVLEEYQEKIYGNILPRPLNVCAKDCTFTYGDEILLEFDCDLIEGDVLDGALEIDNKFVGEHAIKQGTLSNPNYIIENFESATCTILPRTAYVQADELGKTYGDKDPTLTYSVRNLVEGDELFGELSRQEGEDVGKYAILKGDLSNSNYDLVFEGNTFTIMPREIFVLITFLNKEYDGQTDAFFEVEFLNNIKNEDFQLNLQAHLSDKNCGKVGVEVQNKEIIFEKSENYFFTFKFMNSEIEITKRPVNVFVDVSSKEYGNPDPLFTFVATNMVEDETLDLCITRKMGEDVGEYEFLLDESGFDKNPNYEINFVSSNFEITPRKTRVSVENQTKFFGDEDPVIRFKLVDDLCFEDTAQKVFDGQISREAGESVGVYEYYLDKISSNQNYLFCLFEETNFIILKRPVVVTCQDATKTYGDQDPIFSYTVSNDIEGERLSVQIIREYGEDVGKHKLLCGTTNDARYAITFEEAFLTITPCEIAVKADEKVKFYGDDDPTLTVSITEGFLKNNDHMDDIIQGHLERTQGEDVGTYEINQGNFSFGANYILNFQGNLFEILQRHVTIKALKGQKTYGEEDPTFEFEVLCQGYEFSDKVEGALSREDGENVGIYQILQGDISLSKNFSFDFVGAEFEILKRKIEIVPTTLSKQYGDEEPELEFEICGEMIGEDRLSGELFREHDQKERESTGRYQIFSTLENSNYDVILNETFFTILPREVTIKANSIEMKYGDEEPELSYQIEEGKILDGDVVQGSLRRVKGNAVGEYDIISTLSLGRNYDLHYVKGTVKILPLQLTIQSKSHQKTYGQNDPAFEYEIVEGKLINGDKLYGNITREEGEDIGTYALVKSVYNANYDITLLPATLEIVKKDVFLVTSIYDKIFDGTKQAFLRNPYVSGIIDDVSLVYDKDSCAEFETEQVGRNISVFVHDVTLGGEKAKNYNLILPEKLFGNITQIKIATEDVSVAAKDPVLFDDFKLGVSVEGVEGTFNIDRHTVLCKYDIWIEQNLKQLSPQSQYTIKINLPKKVFSYNNIYVYQKLADGTFKLLESKKIDDGEIVVSATSLGEFFVTTDDESWLDYAAIISVFILAFLCIFALCETIKKLRKRHKI